MKKGTCKHFNGFHNTHCAAGVCYRDVTPDPDTPGSALRRPCRTIPFSDSSDDQEEFAKRGMCEKLEEPTSEEIAKFEAGWKRHMDNMALVNKALDPIRKEHKGKSWQGTIECPVCKGKLHLSHSGYNGHMRVHCETEECVRWME